MLIHLKYEIFSSVVDLNLSPPALFRIPNKGKQQKKPAEMSQKTMYVILC